MSIRIGLGRLRNQVSAVKKLQTPSRTTKTTTILVAFVVLNKLLIRAGAGRAIASDVAARCGSRALRLVFRRFLSLRRRPWGCQ